MDIPTIDDIRTAAGRIAGYARYTPVLTDDGLDELAGAALFFKCEMLQRAGAFKFRGACNAVMSLTGEVASRGVATHSSGNHAAALALAAKLRGIPAHVVMPSNAPEVKRRAVREAGGQVVTCEATLAAREEAAARLVTETGATMVHPYDDARVIAGQGTLALELHKQVPGLDAVIAPVSGGGLMSGIAIATAGVSPRTEVYAAEPELADDAFQSLKAGRLVPSSANGVTIADGLRATLSERTLAILKKHVQAVITVSEAEIVAATRLVWERLRVVAEPSAAVSLAAVVSHSSRFAGKRVGIVLSGGNLDLDRLPWMQ
ncbi:MAG: pyridoxal-phosphate dependent enzyme [Gemmataceae bacterium]